MADVSLQGSTAGVSSTTSVLSVSTLLVGSLAAATSAVAYLGDDGVIAIRSSVDAVSTAAAYLSLVPDFDATPLFWRPHNEIIETLEWKTEVLKAHDGTEQRIKVRDIPRQYFKYQLFLDTDKKNAWFSSIIHTWQKLKWTVPIWGEYVEHTGTINAGDNTITVDTTYADFRASSTAMIWKSETEYEVVSVLSKADSALTLDYSVLSTYTGTKYIMPVRTCYMTKPVQKTRKNSTHSWADLTFSVWDNASVTGYSRSTYYTTTNMPDAPSYSDVVDLLITPAHIIGNHGESSNADLVVLDYNTGIFEVLSDSDFNILTQDHAFFNDTKQECWEFRQLLHALNGRQKTVFIPTFRADLTQVDDIAISNKSVIVENIGLTDNLGVNNLRSYIGFYFSSTATLIIRKISAIDWVSAATEKVTFDHDLGLSSVVAAGDCTICFVDKCRLASDKVQIKWPFTHRNECRVSLIRVP